MYMKKIELLAPAGNMESLKAAIYAGCDAVYVGGKLFGARNYADNFGEEELAEAVELCHLYGKRIYITVNTLLYEAEVKSFMKYIDTVVELHVDALIMQDLGMIDLVRQTYPDMEIHASTQMHIHTLEGVFFAQSLGIKRVVLARETPMDIIHSIKQKSSMEIEVFGHGALCVSYSGQCLMSSLIGGRSGNRGTCAQCCRQKYSLVQNGQIIEKDTYLLSPKDLNILENLEAFITSGIDSLKIEGRMKRPEYVYLVVRLYREKIDAYYKTGKVSITKQDLRELHKIFNRGFTKGFLFGEDNESFIHSYRPNHMGIPIGKVTKIHADKVSIQLIESLHIKDGIRILNAKEDQGLTVYKMRKNGREMVEAQASDTIDIVLSKHVEVGDIVHKTTDYKQLEHIQTELKTEIPKISICGKVMIEIGKKVVLEIDDHSHKIIVQSEEKIEPSQTRPATKEEIKEKISKLGDTIYTFESLEVTVEEGSFVPVKVLNELRRSAITQLNTERLKRKPVSKGIYKREVKDFSNTKKTSVSITSLEAYTLLKDKKVDYIYVESPLYEKLMHDPRVIRKLPRVMQVYPIVDQQVLIGEVGCLYAYKPFITDFSIPVTNSYTVAFLHSIGAERVTLSYELGEAQVEKLVRSYLERYHTNPNLEWIIYGKEEVMVTKYNPLARYKIKEGTLMDRFGNPYLIRDHGQYTIIYNWKARDQRNYEKYYQLGISVLCFHSINSTDIRNIIFLK